MYHLPRYYYYRTTPAASQFDALSWKLRHSLACSSLLLYAMLLLVMLALVIMGEWEIMILSLCLVLVHVLHKRVQMGLALSSFFAATSCKVERKHCVGAIFSWKPMKEEKRHFAYSVRVDVRAGIAACWKTLMLTAPTYKLLTHSLTQSISVT